MRSILSPRGKVIDNDMRQTTPTIDATVAATERAFRFSTRELLIAISAVASILGGFTMYGLFCASMIALIFGALLTLRGRRTKRSWITRTGIALAVLSCCTSGLLLAAWLMFGIGPIYSAASFPDEFKKMAEVANADVNDAKVSGLGSFIDNEHVWRLTLSSDQLDRVVADYGLVDVPVNSVPQSFWRAFPRSWRPSHDEGCRYFSTPGFPATSRGPDGDHCFGMYDSMNSQLYVWHKFNF